jgi:hypothetical protein
LKPKNSIVWKKRQVIKVLANVSAKLQSWVEGVRGIGVGRCKKNRIGDAVIAKERMRNCTFFLVLPPSLPPLPTPLADELVEKFQ